MKRLLIIILLLLLVACGGEEMEEAAPSQSVTSQEPIRAIATTSFIAEFLEYVGGDRVEIYTILKPGSSYYAFEPTMGDAREIGEADIIFSNGVGLESPWLDDLRESTGSEAVLEVVSFGAFLLDLDHRDHGHANGDPHIWLSTDNAVLMVDNIAFGLSEFDPDNADVYTANAEAYKVELARLTEEMQTILATIPEEQRKLVTSHEAYAYFAQQFGFEMVGTVIIASHESKQYSARDVEALIATIQAQGIPAVFAGAALDVRQAETVAREAGVTLVPELYADSLGSAESNAATYIGMMRHNAELIAQGLTP